MKRQPCDPLLHPLFYWFFSFDTEELSMEMAEVTDLIVSLSLASHVFLYMRRSLLPYFFYRSPPPLCSLASFVYTGLGMSFTVLHSSGLSYFPLCTFGRQIFLFPKRSLVKCNSLSLVENTDSPCFSFTKTSVYSRPHFLTDSILSGRDLLELKTRIFFSYVNPLMPLIWQRLPYCRDILN